MRYISILFTLLSLSAPFYGQSSHPGSAPGAYSISGIALNTATGQPLPYAHMRLISVNQEPIALVQTGSDGRFCFQNLPAAKYQLVASRIGFPRQGLNQHENYFSAVVTGPGQSTTGILFRLQPEAVISGRITDDYGDPVSPGTVILFRRNVYAGHALTVRYDTAMTDDTGYYRFGDLLPGTYFVAVQADPWYAIPHPQFVQDRSQQNLQAPASLDVSFPVTFYPDATDNSAALPISLHPGDEFQADFQLKSQPSAHLLIQSANSAMVESSAVLFDNTELPRMSSAQFRSSDGSVEVTGFAPGNLQLSLTEFNSDGPPDVRQTELSIGSSTSISAAGLSNAISVSGTIKMDGEPLNLSNSSLMLRERTSGRIFNARLSSDNSFSVDGNVPDGAYDIYLFAQGVYLRGISGADATSDGKGFETRGNSVVNLVLDVSHSAAQVEGVALLDGKPFAGAMVLLISATDPQDGRWDRQDQSDSDGTFRLRDVAPGRYLLVALRDGWSLDLSDRYALAPFLAAGQPLQLSTSQSTQVKVAVR